MKVIMNVTKIGSDLFAITTEDGLDVVNNWSIVGFSPVEYTGSNKSKVKDAIKMKKEGFEDDTILEILK